MMNLPSRSAIFFSVVLLTAVVNPALSQTVMFDCTGSLANADKLQARLIDGLARANPSNGSFGVCLFSGSVLGADVQPVEEHLKGGKSRIEHVNQSRREELRQAVKRRLDEIFESKPKAAKTSHAAVFARAESESRPVLVVTDAKDESKAKMTLLGSGEGVHVVLCPAVMDDVTRELQTSEARKRLVLSALPNAVVYQCHQLDRAIHAWSTTAGSAVRRASQIQ